MTRFITKILFKSVEKYVGPLDIYFILLIKLIIKLINNLQLLFFFLSLSKKIQIIKTEYLIINDFNNKDLITNYVSFIIFNVILLK